jgi:hypothetical protein
MNLGLREQANEDVIWTKRKGGNKMGLEKRAQWGDS